MNYINKKINVKKEGNKEEKKDVLDLENYSELIDHIYIFLIYIIFIF